MGQLDKAAECVESNLLLLSNANSVMAANKAFYLQQTGLSSDHFVARQVCIVIALPVLSSANNDQTYTCKFFVSRKL